MRVRYLTCILWIMAGVAVAVSSCTKPKANTDESVTAQDVTNVSAALNTTDDDASNALSVNQKLVGSTLDFEAICGATVIMDTVAGKATITYTSSPCLSKIVRTGIVTISLLNYNTGTRWRDKGATLQIEFNNVRFENTKTGASYNLNGTYYLVNTTGGFAYEVMDNRITGTVTHKHIADNLSITFNDSATRTWSVRRSRTFSNTTGVNTITLTGDTTVDGYAGIETWGTNRNGESFESSIDVNDPIVATKTCGYLHPISGEYYHYVASNKVVILLGVDQNGNPISAGGCAYGYEILLSNTGSKRPATQIEPYWF